MKKVFAIIASVLVIVTSVLAVGAYDEQPVDIPATYQSAFSASSICNGQRLLRTSDTELEKLDPIAEYVQLVMGVAPIGIAEFHNANGYGYCIFFECALPAYTTGTYTDTTITGHFYAVKIEGATAQISKPKANEVNLTSSPTFLWRRVYDNALTATTDATANGYLGTSWQTCATACKAIMDALNGTTTGDTYTEAQYLAYGQQQYTQGQNSVKNNPHTYNLYTKAEYDGVAYARDQYFEEVQQLEVEYAQYVNTHTYTDTQYTAHGIAEFVRGYGTEEQYRAGIAAGYANGYAYGHAIGSANTEITNEVVALDLPQVITAVPTAIRGMFDSAFDLELFTDTVYEVNVGQILAVLLAVIAAVGIIAIILKKVL